jgi:hypothetical protein
MSDLRMEEQVELDAASYEDGRWVLALGPQPDIVASLVSNGFVRALQGQWELTTAGVAQRNSSCR